jgi:hypothetical protein
VVVEDQDGRRAGFGSEPDDLSLDGIRQALEQAKLNAVSTPAFDTFRRARGGARGCGVGGGGGGGWIGGSGRDSSGWGGG